MDTNNLIADLEAVLAKHRLRARAPACPDGFLARHTGGGCMAWIHREPSPTPDDESAYEVVITSDNDPGIPEAFPVMIGVYETGEADALRLWESVGPESYDAVVQEALGICKASAQSVYHYFFEIFGYRPDDSTLRDLPVGSGCGEDCKRVIDAAKALVHLPEMEVVAGSVMRAAERACSVYWRG